MRRQRRPRRAHAGEDFEPLPGQFGEPPVADPVDVAKKEAVRGERLARADDDTPARGVEMNDVERLPDGDADAAALPDRIADDAVVAAEHATVDMDDVAGLG